MSEDLHAPPGEADSGFFRQDSPFLSHPLLTAERTAAEIDFLEAALKLPPGAWILDVGCGFGRHSVELARRGYQVVGIDPAAAMIRAAEVNAEDAQVQVDFRQERAELFDAEGVFDAAICMFTTLGQINEYGDNFGLVPRVWTALKDGGRFVVEVPQRSTAAAQLRPNDRFGGDDSYAEVTRFYDEERKTLCEEFRVVKKGDENRFKLQYRLLSAEELGSLLEDSGFLVEQTVSDHQGGPLAAGDPMMIFIAKKGG